MKEPEVGLMRPARILNRVVLPEPDGPSTHKNSRGRTSKVISASACRPPFSFGNTALRLWMVRIGVWDIITFRHCEEEQSDDEAISWSSWGCLRDFDSTESHASR